MVFKKSKQMIDMQQLAEAIKTLEGNTLILTHHNADIDAIACAIVLKNCLEQLGKKAEIGVSESVSRPGQKIVEKAGCKILIDPDCSKFEKIILVDTSVPEQLIGVKNFSSVEIIIDHHPEGPLVKDAKETFIDKEAKSAAQLVYRLSKELGCELDKKNLEIILAGIVSDSAHLRFAGVEEFGIVLEILKKGISFSEVLELTETDQDFSEAVACLKAAKRADVYKVGELLVCFSNLCSHEAAACRAFLKLGADIAVVFTIRDGKQRISSRGKPKILECKIDLSEIFQEVGKLIEGTGGGHDLAGSANGKLKDMNKIKKFILGQLSNKTGKEWKPVE